ncbi:hypothetical protein [Pseudocitrobacter faecalis]|uniref:Uncharacterized protein n=1 Tax=Pseudocitrobacter faecalis TaxID=1398493 RepID=A0ABX9FVL9_9ENTR|nr:hypothetical protein DFQ50_108288 [Pseudocitrobacter faecalis]
MTTPITKEQAQRLRNDFECWQQDYDPVADKEQFDMFGLGMIAMDALLAAMDAEPVADVVAWHKEGEERTCDIRWRRFDVAPGPLFAVAHPVALVPDDISGPLAHAYKELTPTFMRNHIAVFERYGITPNDSSTVIQALRIALDGIERRAAMLNHS